MGFLTFEKEISKEIYERSVQNRNRIVGKDEEEVFSDSERYGYVVVKDRGENPDTRYVIFYTNDTKRNEQYERKCQEAGLTILKFSNS
jgi:hypothetical protein